jgi:hypothetical protein
MLLHNPLTVRGRIERCWLFAYQTPVEAARSELPPELEPVTHGGCAFWSVVVCRLAGMRPPPLPAFLGVGYWHVAYRIYARFHPLGGAPVEGLYFLRSDCNSRLMAAAGNLLTDFRFHMAPVKVTESAAEVRIDVAAPDAPASALLDRVRPPELPGYSAFASIDEAAAFLKYQPRGFSITGPGRVNVIQIERDEAAWRSRLVRIEQADWAFLSGRPVRPEICYDVEPIDYQWNRGRTYRQG